MRRSALRIGYRTGAEDRYAAIVALTAPIELGPLQNSETHGPLPFASERSVDDDDFEREMPIDQPLAKNETRARRTDSSPVELRSVPSEMWPTGTAVPKSGSIRAKLLNDFKGRFRRWRS